MLKIIAIIWSASIIYQLISAFCSRAFKKRLKEAKKIKRFPKVLLLKPLCGIDKDFFENILSFLRIPYPGYKLLLGVAKRDDPAYKLAKKIKDLFPDKVILTEGEAKEGSNRKVRNLMNMERHIPQSSEIIILSDSDTKAEPSYIEKMISPILEDSSAGATTAIYRIEGRHCIADLIEILNVEANFIPAVLFSAFFTGYSLRYAFGASIAIRRDVLEKIGGFSSVKDYLADDYMLAKLIVQKGYKVILAPYIVKITSEGKGIKDAFLKVLRWNRTVKTCNPFGYFFTFLCHPTPWALILYLITGEIFLLLFTVLLRIICGLEVLRSIDSDKKICIFTPFGDFLFLFLWLISFLGKEVFWRGKRYRVYSDGRMEEIG